LLLNPTKKPAFMAGLLVCSNLFHILPARQCIPAG